MTATFSEASLMFLLRLRQHSQTYLTRRAVNVAVPPRRRYADPKHYRKLFISLPLRRFDAALRRPLSECRRSARSHAHSGMRCGRESVFLPYANCAVPPLAVAIPPAAEPVGNVY
jgi:hypothetical protein